MIIIFRNMIIVFRNMITVFLNMIIVFPNMINHSLMHFEKEVQTENFRVF